MRRDATNPARILGAALLLLMPLGAQAADEGQDWSAFGRDASNAHHSPLKAIDTSNVAKLRPAWL